ncbi:Rv1535 family protein [Candidatus Mycobacterium methanotrophicum]|uniref:Rv1535 family protein n=1 Tax=Candidatus Mycobacterium methanotrophicum TaxID=2943498 RepID=A0ABY4QFQ0_9MYCO|nr:Rv1535 family protein [Candidatus Mycobacterium methanotrophicum]UQX09341.1 Rv1535 family protein [Candidatus Mycobacterium methanotrophicum]
MTAVLYDEVVTATPARRLRAVPAPAPTPVPKPASRWPEHRLVGGDPLVMGAARLLCVPLRQLYAALWRVGVLEVGA